MGRNCPISAIFPTTNGRLELALHTLAVLQSCDPPPAEIIVYVDGGPSSIANAIAQRHPATRVLHGNGRVGPGGARNMLVEAATHELVASFDDDSYPEQPGYFQRVLDDFGMLGDIAVLSAASQQCEKDMPGFMHIGIFSGCGCVFRRSWFLRTRGHVPLPIAYCMEEVDVSLQLFALGGTIIHDPRLVVVHDRPRPERPDPETNAVVLANTALLPFLRYPIIFLPLGAWHVISRILFLLRKGWLDGLASGLLMIPRHLSKYRGLRSPIAAVDIIRWRRLCRRPELVKGHAP